MSKPKIFLSYSSSEREWASKLADALTRRGLGVYFDAFVMNHGANWQESLIHALRTSDVYVPVINRTTFSNHNILFELGVAAGAGRLVVPVIPETGVSPPLLQELSRYASVRTSSPEIAADRIESVILKASSGGVGGVRSGFASAGT